MLSRRQFVASALAAGVAPASQEVIAQPAKRTIVDAQVHLWKAESEDWKWVPGMKPQMPEPFTIEKLVPLMDQGGVDRVVIVPPSWPGDRNDYALEAAKLYPNRFAVMGRIPLKNPQAAALLPKWKEQPGMLGVRLTFLGPAQAWLTDGTPDWFWPEAEKAGLPVDVLDPWPERGACARRGTPSAAAADRRSHGRQRRHRQGRPDCGRDKPDRFACQISKCLGQVIVGAKLLLGGLPVPRFHAAHQTAVRCLWSKAMLLGHRHYQRLRQGDL